MRLDLSVDKFFEVVGRKAESPDKYLKGAAIYNTSMDKFLCREYVDDNGCPDPDCHDVDFTWKENKLWLLNDVVLSHVVKNIEQRDNGWPISREVPMAKQTVTDFLWEWMEDCTVVDCTYYQWTVHNRRGFIYGITQFLRGKGYPSSELIPETHDEITIVIDHVHSTSLLSIRNDI